MSGVLDSLTSLSSSATGTPDAQKLPPCNNTASSLYQVLITCIIPIIAAIYCIMQLLYRGSMGFLKILDVDDFEHKNKMRQVFGSALFWFILFVLFVPSFNYFIYNKFKIGELLFF
jgi:hypothetical protein